MGTASRGLSRGKAGSFALSVAWKPSRGRGDLLERAQKGGWNIVVLEPEIDLSSPYGEAIANILVTFAQLERRMISARTKRLHERHQIRAAAPMALVRRCGSRKRTTSV